MNLSRMLAGLALAVALTMTSATTVEAAPPLCQGQVATITADGGEVVGTEGDDVISTTGLVDIDALGGNDTICLERGEVAGGEGDDSVVGEPPAGVGCCSRLVVDLGPGDDTLMSVDLLTVVDSPLLGGDSAGRDHITTGAGSDEVFSGVAGEPNLDQIDLGSGADQLTVTLSAGSDVLAQAEVGETDHTQDDLTLIGPASDAAAWQVNLGGPVTRAGIIVADFAGFEDHELDFGTNVRVGVQGTSAKDVLLLRGGGTYAAELGDGDDVLHVFAAQARGSVDGGPGTDNLTVQVAQRAHVDLRGGRLIADGNDFAVAGLETGTVVADEIRFIGHDGPDDFELSGCMVRADGRSGKDRIRLAKERPQADCKTFDIVASGGRGNDTIQGSGRRDRLVGGKGNDVLRGGKGPDVLIGGPGRDKARGGPGKDKCVAESKRSCER